MKLRQEAVHHKVQNALSQPTYQLATGAFALFFNLRNSFEAQVASVFVRFTLYKPKTTIIKKLPHMHRFTQVLVKVTHLLLLPCANISFMGSKSSSCSIGAPNAKHKSPTRPAATATVASECSLSCATTVMNWTMKGMCGSNKRTSGLGTAPSPFKPCTSI